MKKYLMIGFAAVAFAACSNHDFETFTQAQIDKACEDFLGANGEEIEIWNSTHGQTMAPKRNF